MIVEVIHHLLSKCQTEKSRGTGVKAPCTEKSKKLQYSDNDDNDGDDCKADPQPTSSICQTTKPRLTRTCAETTWTSAEKRAVYLGLHEYTKDDNGSISETMLARRPGAGISSPWRRRSVRQAPR